MSHENYSFSTLLPLLKVKLGKILEFDFDKLIDYLFRLSKVGSKGNTLCVNCQNNTKGEQCHQCMEGRNIFLQTNCNKISKTRVHFKQKKEFEFCHKFRFSNPYIFANQHHRPLIF